MTLYLINGKGVWGDDKSHPLPCTVKVVPSIDLATVDINGKHSNVVAGSFRLDCSTTGSILVKLNGTPCEPLVCINSSGESRVHAAGADFRAMLPLISKVNELQEIVERHDKQLFHKDIFT